MAIKQDISSGIRSATAIFLSVLLTFLGLGLLLWVLARTVRFPALDPAFFDQFSAQRRFFDPQPFCRVGFQAVCLVSPLLVLLTLPLSIAWANRLPQAWLAAGGGRRLAVVFTVLIGLAVAACLSRIVYFPHPPEFYNSPRWLLHSLGKHLSWRQALCVAGIDLGLAWFFIRLRHPSAGRRRAVWLLLLAAWLFSSPIKFFSAEDVADTGPFMLQFNAVAHSAVEVANGRHRLVDFTNQYGGYVEFLGPLLRVLPHRVESLALTFCLLHAAALFFLLLLVRRLIDDDRLCLIVGLGLLFCGTLYMNLFSEGEFLFQSYALRAFFPGMAFCAAFSYFRKPSAVRWAAVSVLIALATIWNLESGIFLWAAWLAGLSYAGICRKQWKELAVQVAWLGLLTAAVWGFFWVYLFAASGHWPDGQRLAAYQKIFYGSGMGNHPMVIPDVWLLLIGVYIVGMVRCGLGYFQGGYDGRKAFSFMLVIFGMGLFSYFQNRPGSSSLLFVSYPAVLLFGSWADEVVSRNRDRPFPGTVWEWGWVAPGLPILLWWAANFTVSIPPVAQGYQREVGLMLHPRPTPFRIGAAFIQSQTTPGEPCLILSRQSGLDHFVSATPGMLYLSSPEEWETVGEYAAVISALRERRLPKVFLDQDFYLFSWVRPEILKELDDALARYYQPAAVSANGQVTLYLPRATPPASAPGA